MKTTYKIGLIGILALFISMGLASAQQTCFGTYCPVSGNPFYQNLNTGISQNTGFTLGALSDFTALLPDALMVLLVLVIAVPIIMKFLQILNGK